nr:hypothetical protein Itr_chr01CG12880 [Ipomoea trifida]
MASNDYEVGVSDCADVTLVLQRVHVGYTACADVTLVLQRVHVGYTACAHLGYLHFKANSFSTFHRGRTLVHEFTRVYDEYFSGLNKILDA